MRISLYTPLRPATMRAYFAPGSWQHGNWWRTMTRRQSQIPLVCNSLRDLPRITQVFARFGEPGPALSPSIRASTRTNFLPPQPVQARDRSFVIRHLAFGIVQRISPESSPQDISPVGPAAAGPLAPPTTRHGWPWEWSAPDKIQRNN